MRRKPGHITPMEQTFLKYFLEGASARESARRAGYKSDSAITEVLQRPEIQKIVNERQTARLRTEAHEMAVETLMTAMDPKTNGVPWPTRIAAAKEVLERVTGKAAGDASKPLSEMTREELADRLDQLKGELADRSKPLVIEAEPIDDRPESGMFE